MKFNIPKDWLIEKAPLEEKCESVEAGVPPQPDVAPSRSCASLTGYERWSHELKTLARKKHWEWLISNDEPWMIETFNDGDSPKEALDHLVAEATRNA